MSDKNEEARDLTEQALEKLDRGDTKGADALLDQAQKIDKSAVEELDEDANKG